MQVSALCQKFRIETSEVEILYTLNQKPKEESIQRFNELIAPFRSTDQDSSGSITSETEPDSVIVIKYSQESYHESYYES